MHFRLLRRFAKGGRRKEQEEEELERDTLRPSHRGETRSEVQVERQNELPVLYPATLYRSLDQTRNEIRLLLVKPGKDDEPLHCEFLSEFLVEPGRTLYESISYAWGDAKSRSHIFLHGVAVDIPASAAAALRRMRLVVSKRVVWM